MWESIHELDVRWLTYLNNLGTATFDAFWLFTTNEVSWIPLFVVIILGVYRKFNADVALKILVYTLLLLAVDLIVTELVKETVSRIRPNNNRALIHQLRILTTPSNYSFFSGHASTSFAITYFLLLTLKGHFKWVKWLWIWPFLFTYSRIYVGVHYPSDLIVGSLFGVLIAYIFYTLYERNTLKKLFKVSDKPSIHPESARE
jgi:undecaprenyl-diphosphatase